MEHVIAISAMEAVGAAVALEPVVAVHAHELVDAVVSPQVVGVDRAGEVFDALEGVAFGVAARSKSAKHDEHALGQLIVRDRIDPQVAWRLSAPPPPLSVSLSDPPSKVSSPSPPSRKSSPLNP